MIGVTYGPGLVGALLIGLATAKAYALASGKPLIGVHHIHGHICANYIEHRDLEPPFMALDHLRGTYEYRGGDRIQPVQGPRRNERRCCRRSIRQGSQSAGSGISRTAL